MTINQVAGRSMWAGVFTFAFVLCGCTSQSYLPDFMKSDLADAETLNEQVHLNWSTDYAAALSESQVTGKPVLAWFTGSDWCTWCIRLDNEVFQTPQFAEWAAENVVLLEVDFPRRSSLPQQVTQQNQFLKKRYGDHIEGYPTCLFLNGNGEVLHKLGYQDGGPENWISVASNY